jgi:cob(I)alamin adenosyltransferase
MAVRPRQVSWLPGPPPRTFPGSEAQWLSDDARGGIPGHSGGTAPDSHRTSLDHGRSYWRHGSFDRGMTVNLTRIYTKLGDAGETHLGDMSRVAKTHPRIEAYGTVDELNAHLGVALTVPGLPGAYAEWLARVQNDLFDVGADTSVPHGGDRDRLRVRPEQTEWLEARCDEVNATLAPLKSFVLPGGTVAAAQLHVCRTVCRRAERLAVNCGDELNPEVVRYLNRLSDLLFILARGANGGEEPLWDPGRFR